MTWPFFFGKIARFFHDFILFRQKPHYLTLDVVAAKNER